MVAEGALLTVFVLAGNTLLRPLVAAINRIPFDGSAIEATYTVNLTTTAEESAPMRDMLVEHLEKAGYPVAEVETIDRGGERVEIVATLTSTSVDSIELDEITDHIARVHGVEHITWEASTQA
jgi:putative Mg2+ transporter-C (MgtC) family protein